MEWTPNKLAYALNNWIGNKEQLLAAANMLQDQAQEIKQLKADLKLVLDEVKKETNESSCLHDKCDEQTQEINNLKKQITQLSVSREPKIGDRIILIDDESEGIIESLSIAGGARISFDDGFYGNYTRVELITLFAYKESE
jgi:septal ring factor EnvC (AmiA/AmiB activator)